MAAERSITLESALRRGLRLDSEDDYNMQFFSVLTNLKSTEWGLRTHPDIPDIISASELSSNSITIAHPFPQYFKGKSVSLLADATKIFTVDESDMTLTAVTTFDPDAPASTKSIITGGVWQFMDFHISRD